MSDTTPFASVSSSSRTQHVVAATWSVNTENQSKQVGKETLSALKWAARCTLLEAVVESSHQAMKKHATKDSLLVFVAPEFYFSDSAEHFYDENTKEQIRASLVGLSKKYPEMLIVPGSVAWFKTAERSELHAIRRAEGGKENTPRNLAKHVQRYGAIKRPEYQSEYAEDTGEVLADHRKYYAQELARQLSDSPAHVRIARNTVFVLYGGGVWHKYNKRHELVSERAYEVPSYAKPKTTFFAPSVTDPTLPSIKGLKIGIEVCADHEHHSLLSSGGGRNYHLHIICSATVYPAREHSAVRDDGALIHADSRTSGVYRHKGISPANNPGNGAEPLEAEEVKVSQGTLSVSQFTVSVP
jgi:hypothetical protein